MNSLKIQIWRCVTDVSGQEGHLAHAFSDFLQTPAITIPADLQAKCGGIEDLGPDLAKYSKVWDEVKAAR